MVASTEHTTSQPLADWQLAFWAGLRPTARLTVGEWADEFRVLSSEGSAEPGPWRTTRTPYLREIMEALSPSSLVEEVVFQAGIQLGKTECGNNWIGFVIHHSPGPMLFVQQDDAVCRKTSRTRIQPMIDSCPALAERVSEPRARGGTNTTLQKDFPGGFLALTGAHSGSGLRSTPIRYLFLDELDAWPPVIAGEGDPVELAVGRTRTFPNRKIYKCSSPTIEGRSRINAAFKDGDQRYYHVPCPFCGEYQRLEWSRMTWERGRPETVVYKCLHCDARVPEFHKPKMLAAGRWVPSNPSAPARVRSYHLNSLYSPLGWYSWAEAVEDFEKALDRPDQMQVWVNTVLAETFKITGEAPDSHRLFERRENYPVGTVPAKGLVLTAGVDVQGNRLELEVVAWGRGLESWSIDYLVIPGSPFEADCWEGLRIALSRTYPHASGQLLPIRMAGVDSQFASNEVYKWVRRQPASRVLAFAGIQKLPTIIGPPKAVEVSLGGKRLKRGVMLWGRGTDLQKQELYGWLRLDVPTDPHQPYPPGFCHFPQYEHEYFEQLTAEEVVIVKKRGYAVPQWEKRRERNEALDCRLLARSAAAVLGIDRWTDEHWNAILNALGQAPIAPTPARPPSTGPKPSGYLSRWRTRRRT